MQAEMKKLKDELKRFYDENNALSEKLAMVSDSVKHIGQLKDLIGKRDVVIEDLKAKG